jgi:PAS domain S-box-containing protein
MRNSSRKLQLKFTIEFSIFFLILLAAINIYFVRAFEFDVYEKYMYKSEVFSNFFTQNQETFQSSKISDKQTLKKIANLNEALYLVVEGSDHSIIDAINIEVAEQYLYILNQTSNIPKINPIFKVSLPIISNNTEIGRIYVGFNAAKTVASLHKTRFLIALFSLAVFILVTIITYLFSARSFKPITKLSSTLDRIIKGDKEIKIEYGRKNEIGMLAEKINLVLNQLDKSSERVKYLNAKLGVAFKEKIYELDSEISQRKKAELSLHRSEEQFELVFENAPIGMFIVSPFNKIINVNKAFCDITGFYKRELLGSHIKSLFDDFSETNFLSTSDQRHINYYDFNCEKIMVKKNKDKINVIAKSVTIFDHKSIPQHTIVQTLDITEIKKTQKDLMLALEKAEESNRLKSAFLAQMSHEIRTPLNAILTAVPILADEIDKDNEDAQIIINSVDSAGKRLQRTIDMILNMSAVQTGNYKPDFEPVNIEAELAKLAREFNQMSDEKNLQLNFRCLSKEPYIYCDQYTTNQIFQNLIGNSIKYTHQGSINISIENNENDAITIFIKDTGIGMTKEYMESLFSPFSQEDVGQKREYEGNGLGLALVKKYVEINNAEIRVQSEKNVGSVFSVTFKKYQEKSSNTENSEKLILRS